MKMEETFLTMISTVGFPIAITVYLLVRFETRINNLTQSMIELREAIMRLSYSLDKNTKRLDN